MGLELGDLEAGFSQGGVETWAGVGFNGVTVGDDDVGEVPREHPGERGTEGQVAYPEVSSLLSHQPPSSTGRRWQACGYLPADWLLPSHLARGSQCGSQVTFLSDSVPPETAPGHMSLNR